MTTINDKATTAGELLAYLDGRGLDITDYGLIEEALESYFDLTLDQNLAYLHIEED